MTKIVSFTQSRLIVTLPQSDEPTTELRNRVEKAQKRIERDLEAFLLCGPAPSSEPPAPRCPHCGPFLKCSRHMGV